MDNHKEKHANLGKSVLRQEVKQNLFAFITGICPIDDEEILHEKLKNVAEGKTATGVSSQASTSAQVWFSGQIFMFLFHVEFIFCVSFIIGDLVTTAWPEQNLFFVLVVPPRTLRIVKISQPVVRGPLMIIIPVTFPG